MTLVLQWHKIARGAAFHAARATVPHGRPVKYHGHEFAEICWIDAGRGTHRINDRDVPLGVGDVIFIRAGDYHAILPDRGATIRLTNVAFSRGTAEALHARLFGRRASPVANAGKWPAMLRLEAAQLRRGNLWADELAAGPRDLLHLERFLLNLLVELEGPREGSTPAGVPTWLGQACARAQQPEHFARGVEHFVHLCGRSREHVARSVRRHFGSTPTGFLNRLRMNHAQRQLEMGAAEIVEIALECGIENLSHFYTLFRTHAGTTPASYRRRHSHPWAGI